MATWKLSTYWKKSSIERQIWVKDDKVIIREEGYRWGTFYVQSDERPLTDEELINEHGYELGCLDNDECWELDNLDDGCYDTSFYSHSSRLKNDLWWHKFNGYNFLFAIEELPDLYYFNCKEFNIKTYDVKQDVFKDSIELDNIYNVSTL